MEQRECAPCRIPFENTGVGKLKEQLYYMTDAQIEEKLKEYEIPSPGEIEKPGSYIQNTVRREMIENRRKNDIVIVPVGCTENHGMHTVSSFDTLLVTRIAEAVRRKQKKSGAAPVNLAYPINYGVHPPWHQGMYGTVMVSDEAFEQTIMHVMYGLWNDGFRKQIWINNHAQQNEIEKAVKRFMNTFQLPGIYIALEWHRAVREFFETREYGGKLEDRFIHADEAETSLGLELFPEMVKMENAEATGPMPDFKFCPTDISTNRLRTSCDPIPIVPLPDTTRLNWWPHRRPWWGGPTLPPPVKPHERWLPSANISTCCAMIF